MWDEMIEADMRRRFFGRMAGRHETVERILSVSMVVASSATAVVVIGFIDFGAELLALCSAVLAAVTGKLQFGRSSMKNAEFSVVWDIFTLSIRISGSTSTVSGSLTMMCSNSLER